MPKKTLLLTLIALVAAIIGGTVAYLLLSVPRDLSADRLLREARDAVKEKKTDVAREKLRSVIASYPRTDAGAAATAALLQLESEEQRRLEGELATLRKQQSASNEAIKTLSERVAELSKKPAPAPVVATPPAAKKAPPVVKKAAPKKKAPVKRRTTTRRRR